MGTRFRLAIALTMIASLFATSLSASAQESLYQDFANDDLENVWARTDLPVEQHVEARTWIWGPGAITGLLEEPYTEATDGVRQVQYTDKSRMELPWNGGDPNSPWFITQGLLATELMTGMLQVGDNDFIEHEPANIPVAGDPDDTTGPTYAEMGEVMGLGARTTGWGISQVLHRDGSITDNGDLLDYGVTDAYYIPETGHNIASVFWDFMNSTGTIYENGQFVDGPIFQNAFYAVGFPLTEAYWASVKVDNVVQDVLVQCFERRCLTYTPGNPDGWQVESGNIGQHYYNWRYNIIDDGDDEPQDPPIAESFTVSPDDSTNAVGDTHEITVTVEDQYGEAFEGADVGAEVTGGPHHDTVLEPADASTNENGEATLDYEGTDTGTDTITVSVDGIDEDQTVTKTWAEYSLDLDPAEDENPFFTAQEIDEVEQMVEDQLDDGATQEEIDQAIEDHWMDTLGYPEPNLHEITATIVDTDGADFDVPDLDDSDFDVTITDDADDDITGSANVQVEVDDTTGVATISYEAQGDGVDTIEVETVDLEVEGVGFDLSGEASKTWTPVADFDYAPEATFLTMDAGEPYVHSQEANWDAIDVTASVLDQFAMPYTDADEAVEFSFVSSSPTDEQGRYLDDQDQIVDPVTETVEIDADANGEAVVTFVSNRTLDDRPLTATLAGEVNGATAEIDITFPETYVTADNSELDELGVGDTGTAYSWAANGGDQAINARFDITVDLPSGADCSGDAWTDWFEATAIDGDSSHPDLGSFNGTFTCQNGSFEGHFGNATGFPMPAGAGATTTFTFEVKSNAIPGTYTTTTDFVVVDDGSGAVVETLDSASESYEIVDNS